MNVKYHTTIVPVENWKSLQESIAVKDIPRGTTFSANRRGCTMVKFQRLAGGALLYVDGLYTTKPGQVRVVMDYRPISGPGGAAIVAATFPYLRGNDAYDAILHLDYYNRSTFVASIVKENGLTLHGLWQRVMDDIVLLDTKYDMNVGQRLNVRAGLRMLAISNYRVVDTVIQVYNHGEGPSDS